MLFASLLIITFGIFNIYSATYFNSGSHYAKMQFLWLIVGLAIVYILLTFDYNILVNYSELFYWLSVILLIYTKFATRSVKGASSWIQIGGIQIEPGEFAKLALVLILAKKLSQMDGKINSFKNLSILIIYSIIPMGLIAAEPNLGMMLICFAIALGVLFIAGLDLKILFSGLLSLIPISLIIWNSGILKAYQKYRIISFLNPEAYSQDSGFQLMNSIIAIASGGIFGKGYLNSTQVSGGFIPEVHTDFIFSVVGEEWGLIGITVFLIVYGIVIYRMIKNAKESKDIVGCAICAGTASAFIFSIFQNIGMTIGLMPVAGITLPFMSYGGSSMLANFISLGLVLNVSMRKKKINF